MSEQGPVAVPGRGPGAMEAVLSRSFVGDHTHYEWLARSVSSSAKTVLDLACGAGTIAITPGFDFLSGDGTVTSRPIDGGRHFTVRTEHDGQVTLTARSAPAHERAIRTLLHWGIEVDEACFLGGLPKGPFLKAFEPDFFFDDQAGHCEGAVSAGPTGQVLYGIANEANA